MERVSRVSKLTDALCLCGCGKNTRTATSTRISHDVFFGKPLPYIRKHRHNVTHELCIDCKNKIPDNDVIHRSRCEECTISLQRKYNKAVVSTPEHKLRVKGNHLLNKYGITLEQYNDIFNKQDRRCAICGSSEPNGNTGWHTDHDHELNKRGKIRGILCFRCNVILGMARDDPTLFVRAVRYLKQRECENYNETELHERIMNRVRNNNMNQDKNNQEKEVA